jgi:hypothetical protein
MTTREADQRLQQLRTAFDTLVGTSTGLSVLPPASPPDGEAAGTFTLRLVGGGSAEVRLRLRTNAAFLTALSGADHEKAGLAEIRDDLGVKLAGGFDWDDSVCASADELAGLLLKHMRRRLKTVSEVSPER